MIEKPHGVQRTLQLDVNENLPRSDSHANLTEFTVNSPLPKNGHSLSNSEISNQSTLNKNQNEKTFYRHHSYQPYLVTQSSIPFYTKVNRQLQTGMALPPFKRILRKCHSGQQTTVTIPPTNFASFTEILEEKPSTTLSFSNVMHQVIPPDDRFTFNKISDQLCETEPRQPGSMSSHHYG